MAGAFLRQQQGEVLTQRRVHRLPPWTLRRIPTAVPPGRYQTTRAGETHRTLTVTGCPPSVASWPEGAGPDGGAAGGPGTGGAAPEGQAAGGPGRRGGGAPA